MSNTYKRILCIFSIIAAVCIIISVFFFAGSMKSAREIENVDHLSGQRIGVVTAYEGDYVLSPRKDITICRYDTEADAVLALCYKQIDAFATTRDAAAYILTRTNGLKINEKPIDFSGMASLFLEDATVMHEFNDFIKVFKQSDEYKEYIERCDNQDYYDGSPLTEETGTGRVFTIGYCSDYAPVTFYDTIHKCANGSEVDIFRRFANYMNYQIEWKEVGEVQGYNELDAGNIEVLLDGYSDVYLEECETSPYYDLSDAYRDTYIVLLEIENYDNVSIASLSGENEE